MSLICRCFTLRMYSKKCARPRHQPGGVGFNLLCGAFLKDDLSSQLHDPSGTGLGHLAKVCAPEGVAHRALARPTSSRSRRIDAILCVVKAIERLQPELETYFSVNWNIFPKPMSQLLIPGCVNVLRPALP